MEKDLIIGLLLIAFGSLFIWWTYKQPVKDGKTDMMNTDFKGYLWGGFAVIAGIIIIVKCVSAGHSML